MPSVPDVLIQEVRHMLSLHCRDFLMVDKADGENSHMQTVLLEKVFHGSEAYASVLDLFIQGKPLYAECFTKAPIQNNREGNDSRQEGFMLELKEIFHCETNKRYYVYDNGFTREALAMNKQERVHGRNINDWGLQTVASYKHALRFYNEYAQAKNHPSRLKKLADMLEFVRKKMFVVFKGAENKSGADKRRKIKPTLTKTTCGPIMFSVAIMPLFFLVQWVLVECHLLACQMMVRKCPRLDGNKHRRTLELKEVERLAGLGGHVPSVYRRGF